MTNNARHALVWLATVHSATRTSSRTHHRNPGLDIRAIFEEGRENAKFSWHVMARARVFQPRSGHSFGSFATILGSLAFRTAGSSACQRKRFLNAMTTFSSRFFRL
eukprot:COSAG06_NODE_2194_length_7378_cov_25.108119_3_plen_106_part_00